MTWEGTLTLIHIFSILLCIEYVVLNTRLYFHVCYRVHQLLVSSLDKLNTKGNTTLIYNESMATLEKLSILKAWAEVSVSFYR